MTIIGIGYKKRSGKDAIADHLVTAHGFRRTAFADRLKEVAMVMFDWSPARMHETAKERVDEFWGLSPRKALQLLGTEAGRRVFGPDIWVKHVKRHMLDYDHVRDWVIPDVRFPDEAEAVKAWGGVVWRVDRPGLPGGDDHASETSMDAYGHWDAVIVNDGSLDELYARVDDAL